MFVLVCTHKCVHVHAHVCVCICDCVCMYDPVYMHMNVCECAYLHVCLCLCACLCLLMRVRMWVCVCTRVVSHQCLVSLRLTGQQAFHVWPSSCLPFLSFILPPLFPSSFWAGPPELVFFCKENKACFYLLEKSITINQICQRKEKPGTCWDGFSKGRLFSRGGHWLKIQKEHWHMIWGTVFY